MSLVAFDDVAATVGSCSCSVAVAMACSCFDDHLAAASAYAVEAAFSVVAVPFACLVDSADFDADLAACFVDFDACAADFDFDEGSDADVAASSAGFEAVSPVEAFVLLVIVVIPVEASFDVVEGSLAFAAGAVYFASSAAEVAAD